MPARRHNARAGRHHGMLRHDQSAAGGDCEHCRANPDQSRSDRRAGHGSTAAHCDRLPTILGCRLRPRPVTCPRSRWQCRRPRRLRRLCSALPTAKEREPWNDWPPTCGRCRRPEAARSQRGSNGPLGGVKPGPTTRCDVRPRPGCSGERKTDLSRTQEKWIQPGAWPRPIHGRPRQSIACQTLPFA